MPKMKVCANQELCPNYQTGDNRPPNHHVRVTVPCTTYTDMTCDMGTRLEVWNNGGNGIACDIGKISKIKRALKEANGN